MEEGTVDKSAEEDSKKEDVAMEEGKVEKAVEEKKDEIKAVKRHITNVYTKGTCSSVAE